MRTINILINNFFLNLKRKKILKFCILMVIYIVIIDIFHIVLICLIYEFSGIDFLSKMPEKRYQLCDILFLSTIIAPLFETFTSQFIPIIIMKRFNKSPTFIIVTSGIIFCVGHAIGENIYIFIYQSIPLLFSGFLLAFSFLNWLKLSKLKAYLITSSIHSMHNIIISIILLIIGGPGSHT